MQVIVLINSWNAFIWKEQKNLGGLFTFLNNFFLIIFNLILNGF